MQAEPPQPLAQNGLRVLLVDDDPVVLITLEEWLTSAGHEVRTRTASVGTAADILSWGPDVVIIDVMMPGLRGDDLARLLKRQPATAGVPVLLHSSLQPEKLRSLLRTTGALGVLDKTSNPVAFIFAFNCLTAGITPAVGKFDSWRPSGEIPAFSGVHRVEAAVDDGENGDDAEITVVNMPLRRVAAAD